MTFQHHHITPFSLMRCLLPISALLRTCGSNQGGHCPKVFRSVDVAQVNPLPARLRLPQSPQSRIANVLHVKAL
jgi:hypothetical protein